MDDEVDTKVLITKLEEIGKNIYTPQVISETEMILIDKEYEIYEKEIDIFIMPGRAFTKEGERLGRGK
jgi:5-formyltetrahydrofolate cyclo-ligase